MPDGPSDSDLTRAWTAAVANSHIARELESIYQLVADQIEARGPACWASGRCCNFEKTNHRLYVTGLETAFALLPLPVGGGGGKGSSLPTLTLADITSSRARGDCPFLSLNLCSIHTVKPLGCRVYFCDRSAQQWQHDLSERAISMIRALHDRHAIPYRYAEWRSLLELFVLSAPST